MNEALKNYHAALEVWREAQRTFDAVRKAYRARKAGDEEFIKAQFLFNAAQRKLDEAESKVQKED